MRAVVIFLGMQVSEWFYQDGLAGLHVAALLLDDDETVPRHHRGEDTRALGARGPDFPAPGPERQNAALELPPSRFLSHRLRRHRGELHGENLAAGGPLPERRADEEEEGEHGGHGVSR